MKKHFASILILCVIMVAASVSYAQDMGIITGNKRGTYYQFGLNLAQLVKSPRNHAECLPTPPARCKTSWRCTRPLAPNWGSSSRMYWPLLPKSGPILLEENRQQDPNGLSII